MSESTAVSDNGPCTVLVVTAMYPSTSNPHSGTFVKSQVDSLASVGVASTVLHLVGRSPWKYVRGIWQVLLAINSGQFDLVHGHYGYCGWVARMQWRLPVVVSFCGDDLLGTPGPNGQPTLISRLIVAVNTLLPRIVDGVIVKSEEMRQVLEHVPSRTPIDVVPNGVDMSLFRVAPRADTRARLGMDPTQRVVLFPADPSIPRKAYPVVAEAVEQLQGCGLNVQLVAVHDRPQSDLVDFYNAADVVVLPSLWEGSPNVVKEAMACSVPIVAADVGDVRQLLSRTPGCAVVDRTPSAFAAAIAQALDIPDGRTTGRSDISHLSVEGVARHVRQIYDRAMARRKRTLAAPRVPA